MTKETLLVLVALVVALATATHVNNCDDTPNEDPNRVKITDCDVAPCNLKKKTRVSIEQIFVPDKDVNEVVTGVHANLLGVDFPFIGVDGMGACNNIFDTEGKNVGCPLKKGNTYVYKTDFPILEFYPKVNLVVEYALKSGNDRVACFRVPAKITG